MPSLRDIKKRINNVGVIEKITQSMKVISTTRLAVAKETRYNNTKYFSTAKVVTKKIFDFYKTSKNLSTFSSELFIEKDKYINTMIIFIASDRGLCGAYNSNVFRQVATKVLKIGYDYTTLVPIGAKSFAFSNNMGKAQAIKGLSSNLKDLQDYELPLLAYQITQLVKDKTVDSIQIVYTKSLSVLEQVVLTKLLLPILPKKTAMEAEKVAKKHPETPINLENQQINTDVETAGYDIEELFYRYILANLEDKLAHAQVAEHASRLNAMDTANSNSKDLKDSLNLEYNKTRQNVITRELIEIISGAESI